MQQRKFGRVRVGGIHIIAVFQMNATRGVPVQQEITPIWAKNAGRQQKLRSFRSRDISEYLEIPDTPNSTFRTHYESSSSGSTSKPNVAFICKSAKVPKMIRESRRVARPCEQQRELRQVWMGYIKINIDGCYIVRPRKTFPTLIAPPLTSYTHT
jgi:hypothetical protein